MSGYTFIGWLDPTGELVKNESPRSPHIPIYWEILESDEWFCFSQQALRETVAKNAILSINQWKRLAASSISSIEISRPLVHIPVNAFSFYPFSLQRVNNVLHGIQAIHKYQN